MYFRFSNIWMKLTRLCVHTALHHTPGTVSIFSCMCMCMVKEFKVKQYHQLLRYKTSQQEHIGSALAVGHRHIACMSVMPIHKSCESKFMTNRWGLSCLHRLFIIVERKLVFAESVVGRGQLKTISSLLPLPILMYTVTRFAKSHLGQRTVVYTNPTCNVESKFANTSLLLCQAQITSHKLFTTAIIFRVMNWSPWCISLMSVEPGCQHT